MMILQNIFRYYIYSKPINKDKYMSIPKSAINQHIINYISSIHDLLCIIISDNEGVHIYSNFHQSVKQKQQKLIQTSTMLISTITQCQGNFDKISKVRQVNPITYFYDQFLIHFRKTKYYYVTVVMRPRTSGLFAEDISAEIGGMFGFLNGVLSKKE